MSYSYLLATYVAERRREALYNAAWDDLIEARLALADREAESDRNPDHALADYYEARIESARGRVVEAEKRLADQEAIRRAYPNR